MADRVGKASALMAPLVEALAAHVFSADRLHGDDTGSHRKFATRTSMGSRYAGAAARARQRQDAAGAAVGLRARRASRRRRRHATGRMLPRQPGPQGIHPQRHLASPAGMLHAVGFAGSTDINRAGRRLDGEPRVPEAACWAHVRRKFFDLAAAGASPVAEAALERIGALYEIERRIRAAPAEQRRRVREAVAASKVAALKIWLEGQLARLPGKGGPAQAIRYALARWQALCRYLADGSIEIDNNAAGRAIRPIALGRENWLFAGSDRGGERAAGILSLIETARLNGPDLERYLRDVLTRIADHPIKRIGEFLAGNIAKTV